MTTRTLRKILAVSLLFLFILAACTGGGNALPTAAPTQPAAQATLQPDQPTEPVPTVQEPTAVQSPKVPETTSTALQPQPSEENPPTGQQITAINAANLQPELNVVEGEASNFTWVGRKNEVVVNQGSQFSIYDLQAKEQTTTIQAEVSTPLVSSPDGATVAAATADNVVHIWSAADGKELKTLSGHTGRVTEVAFARDGSLLASTADNGELIIWNADSGEQVNAWTLPYWMTNLSFSPDGSRLGGADQANFAVHILDATSGEELKSLEWTEHASPALYGAYFSPDWTTLAWVARGTVQLMDVDSGSLGKTLSHEDFISDAAWSPDSSLFATGAAGTIEGNFTPAVFLWDVEAGEQVNSLVLQNPVLHLAFSPDGSQLASLSSDSALQVWTVAP